MAGPESLSIRTKVSEGGRIVIPADFRKALGLDVGDEVVVRLERDAINITTVAAAIHHAQEKVRQYVPEDHSLTEDLIAERRQEASRE